MPLSPQDIVRKEFREALRGYNQADVDLFLDEVVEEYTRLSDENQKMKVRIAALQQEVARRESRGGGTGGGDGGGRMEAEVRSRVRRFLEDQLRLIDVSAPSATMERIARDVPVERESRARDAQGGAPSRSAADPAPPRREEPREPFWAGE